MNDGAPDRWSNHDITSDGRIVEECVGTADSTRRITWYDERGRVARREVGDTGYVHASGRSA